MTFIRPALGLLQGCIVYWLIFHSHLSYPSLAAAVVILTFPLFALQIKLPQKSTLVLGLSILAAMALIYGYAIYYLVLDLEKLTRFFVVTPTIIIQCAVSAFIFFVFYCVIIEEKRFSFPYATLFSEVWQVILKLLLGQLLVSLTWGLCILAAILFEFLNISLIRSIIDTQEFLFIMPPFFFGIAMTILHNEEHILTKLRNILLGFCRFLYPLFVVISLSFMVIIPFSNQDFSSFWQITVLLSCINILLFNGVFQAGLDTPPFSPWFCKLIYASFIITLLYSLYILRFPWINMQEQGIHPNYILWFVFLLILALYLFCYSLAIFFSQKPWLSLIKRTNKGMALLVATLYLGMALPWFNEGKLLNKQPQVKVGTDLQTGKVSH